jgi:hypothetical protein
MSDKPLVFISCGQFTREEIELGNAVERLIREKTLFQPYFAEQQNTLDGLVTNILSALGNCAAFIGIMHHRGNIPTPSGGTIIRGSVWIEQELAIASFIQHVLRRHVEVALYVRSGIEREGLRQQLRLKPIEFETADDVLTDLTQRVSLWQLPPVAGHSLIAEWEQRNVQITGSRHDYKLLVNLLNNGTVKPDDWRIELWFPSEFLEGKDRSQPYVHFYDDNSRHDGTTSRLYPGDKLLVFDIDYYVDNYNWPGKPLWPGQTKRELTLRIRVCSEDMKPWEEEVPMSDLENF